MSTSFWLDWASASKSDARLFSGDEDRCGRSAAPPIIALCANGSNGDWLRVSGSFGAREDRRASETDGSPPLSPSMERPAYAALGELAAEEV